MKRVVAMFFLAPLPLLCAVGLYAFGVSDINRGKELYFLAFFALPLVLAAYLEELICLPFLRAFKRRGLRGWSAAWRVALAGVAFPAALLGVSRLLSSELTPVRADADTVMSVALAALASLGVAFAFWWLGFRHNDTLLPTADSLPSPIAPS